VKGQECSRVALDAESSVAEVSQQGPECRRGVGAASAAKDPSEEGPGVIEVTKFLDELKAGSVGGLR
jgi:hypothetical protein